MIADRLRYIRERRELSQQDLADRSGVSLRQISRYELGESDPTSEALVRLVKVLECSIDFLTGLTDDPVGKLREDDLSPKERDLIQSVRTGRAIDAIQVLGSMLGG